MRFDNDDFRRALIAFDKLWPEQKERVTDAVALMVWGPEFQNFRQAFIQAIDHEEKLEGQFHQGQDVEVWRSPDVDWRKAKVIRRLELGCYEIRFLNGSCGVFGAEEIRPCEDRCIAPVVGAQT